MEVKQHCPNHTKYSKYYHDGPGLDIIIISVGTKDAARLQKLGGIAPHINLDNLVHSQIAQWPEQTVDLYSAVTACLDAYGRAFIVLLIGITSLSNADTGISYFQHITIQYTKGERWSPTYSIPSNKHSRPSMSTQTFK